MFLDKLNRLNDVSGGRFASAIENISKDLKSAANPNGNISEQAQISINRQCVTPSVDIVNVIECHCSYRPEAVAEPRKRAEEYLYRVVPRSFFLTFHLGGFDATSNLGALKELESGPVPKGALKGSTGRPGGPSWWTWGERPAKGRDYVEQLALPHYVIGEAAKSGGVVEIAVPSEKFPRDTYKPSALDGFCEETRFSPDTSNTPHGWTRPDNPATHPPRPELVSESFRYSEVATFSFTTTFLPY